MVQEIRKICCFCECAQQTHVYFHECGLFDGGEVCIECTESMNTEEALKTVNEITGRNITKETIASVCKVCGQR